MSIPRGMGRRSGGYGVAERDEIGARGRRTTAFTSAGSIRRRTILVSRSHFPTWRELLARDDANQDGAIQKDELSDARTKRYWEFIDTEGRGQIGRE